MIRLFHVSPVEGLTVLEPRRPKHWLTNHLLEEGKTKRVSFARSIRNCMRAIPSREGKIYYVYSPTGINEKYLYKPKRWEVPDAYLTGEYWYLRPCPVRLVAIIKAGKLVDQKLVRLGPAWMPSSRAEFQKLKVFNRHGKEVKQYVRKVKEPEPKTIMQKIRNFLGKKQ